MVDSGITLFYVTNRSDEGYASDNPAYEGQTGYADAEGNVVGSSICDVMLLLGDYLNDFSDAFSPSENDAVERVDEAIRHSEYWGARWIVLPNAMYDSSLSAAMSYDLLELFQHFG